MVRRRHKPDEPALNPATLTTTTHHFQAGLVEEVRGAWTKLGRELGLALEPPTAFVKEKALRRCDDRPLLKATMEQEGSVVAEAQIHQPKDKGEVETGRKLIELLLADAKTRLTADHCRLARRLRSAQLEGRRGAMRKAWKGRDAAAIADLVQEDPAWLSLLRPVTAAATLATLVRSATRLALTLEATAQDPAKAKLKELRLKLGEQAGQAAAALAAHKETAPQGFGPTDSGVLATATSATLSALVVGGKLAELAAKAVDQEGEAKELLDALRAVKEALGPVDEEEEEGEEEEAGSKRRRFHPKPILKAPKAEQPKTLAFLDLVREDDGQRRFALVKDRLLKLAKDKGVRLHHLRRSKNTAELRYRRTCLVLVQEAAEPTEALVAEFRALLDGPVLPADLPTEAEAEQALLGLFHLPVKTGWRTAEEQVAALKLANKLHKAQASPEKAEDEKEAEKVRWRESDVTVSPGDLAHSPLANLTLGECKSLNAPLPGSPVDGKFEVQVEPFRHGTSVVLLLGVALPTGFEDLVAFEGMSNVRCFIVPHPTILSKTGVDEEPGRLRKGLTSGLITKRKGRPDFTAARFSFSLRQVTAERLGAGTGGHGLELHIGFAVVDVAQVVDELLVHPDGYGPLQKALIARVEEDGELPGYAQLLVSRLSVGGLPQDGTLGRLEDLSVYRPVPVVDADGDTSVASSSPLPESPRSTASRLSELSSKASLSLNTSVKADATPDATLYSPDEPSTSAAHRPHHHADTADPRARLDFDDVSAK